VSIKRVSSFHTSESLQFYITITEFAIVINLIENSPLPSEAGDCSAERTPY